MTIEITDQMVYAFAGEPEITATDAHAIRVGLEAVLAIVQRDYRLDRICREELMPGVHCAKPAHVKGDHEAKLPTGSAVSWS